MLWEFIKRNLFAIVIIATLLVAMPWLGYIFIIPVVFVLILGIVISWKLYRLRNQIIDEAQRQQGEQQRWQRTRHREEGEVTVVQTEQSEQKVNDEVGEYVDFKEIKENKE